MVTDTELMQILRKMGLIRNMGLDYEDRTEDMLKALRITFEMGWDYRKKFEEKRQRNAKHGS